MTAMAISPRFQTSQGNQKMSEQSNVKAVYDAYKADDRRGPLAGPLFVARVVAIVAAIGGAVPTGMNLYQSWKHNIPYSEVSHRLSQYDLWMKNFDCQIDYRALNVSRGTRVDVGACPRSGDIAIKITAPTGQATYEWLAFDQLQKKTNAAVSFLGLIATAHASESSGRTRPQPNMTYAQATPVGSVAQGMEVICQAMPAPGRIVRIVKEGDKCYRESIAAMQGKVEKREEVPCNTQCTPSG